MKCFYTLNVLTDFSTSPNKFGPKHSITLPRVGACPQLRYEEGEDELATMVTPLSN